MISSQLTWTILLTVQCLAICSAHNARPPPSPPPNALPPRPTIDHGPFPANLHGCNFTYPHPINIFRFASQSLDSLEMTFMDIPPTTTNYHQNHHGNKNPNINTAAGQKPKPRPIPYKTNAKGVAILLHGRNFCGATWSTTATALSAAGYRVIVPDQIGFCKSSKPGASYQYSAHQLAHNTAALLSTLGIITDDNFDTSTTTTTTTTTKSKTLPNQREQHQPALTIIGHSLGGLLALRLSHLLSQSQSHPPSQPPRLILLNPINLEPYLILGVPYRPPSFHLPSELATNYTTIRAYEHATYYPTSPLWQPEYDVWARMLAQVYAGDRRDAFIQGQTRIVDMVLTQPLTELDLASVRSRTLLLVGTQDTTAIGKQWAPPEVQRRLGRYDVLGKRACRLIPQCTLVEFEDLGHAPQIQAPERVHEAMLAWLDSTPT